MTYKAFSILTLYSMLIQVGMVIGGALVWKQRIEHIKKEKPHFGHVMVEATFLGALVTLITSPFANLVESSKKAEYLSSWADYQVKYHKLSYKYCMKCYLFINHLTPNDNYSGRTAPLTSKSCILYIYSTNTGTEYFKHGIYSPLFPLQNAVCFIILIYLVPVLFTFYTQDVLKFKKIIPAPKG